MQKYTLRITHYKSVKPVDGKFPLYFQLGVNRKQGYKATGHWIRPNEWDEEKQIVKDRRDAGILNNSLGAKLRANLKILADLEHKGVVITHKSLKTTSKLRSFYKYYTEVRKDDAGRFARWEILRMSGYMYSFMDNPPEDHMKAPLKEPAISEITIAWARGFEDYMRDVLELAEGTINTTFSGLRKVLNQAVKEELIFKCPVGANGHPVPPPKPKPPTFLVEQEREALIKLLSNGKIKNPSEYRTLVYFLLGCYSGIRFSDWGKFDPVLHVVDGKIILRANKNDGDVVMPIGVTLKKIIDNCKKVGKLNLSYGMVSDYLPLIAEKAGIKKHISTHVARHSFGYMCPSIGLSKQETAYYMGITEQMVNTYYHLAGKHVLSKTTRALKAI